MCTNVAAPSFEPCELCHRRLLHCTVLLDSSMVKIKVMKNNQLQLNEADIENFQ